MPYAPETDRYPYTPEEVLIGLDSGQRILVVKAARAMTRTGPTPEQIIDEHYPGVHQTAERIRLLGRAGSYAKAQGWWRPGKQS